jgi:peptidoglycan/xylan/chitin deacetylase (PgdA/CDA1 family)
MSRLIDVLLLFALPASGKSEVRRYLASLTPEQCRDQLHLGPTVQLDDYPYVHKMRRVSQELRKRGADGMFFDSDDLPMKQPLDWGTLIELLNEDFEDLRLRRRPAPPAAAEWLLERFDRARAKVGAKAAFGALPGTLRKELAVALEREAAELLRDKNAGVPDSLEGRTVVIEAARGGPDGASMPLPAPLGYRYSIGALSEEILSRASILYVWVTPEESRRKNHERTDPNDPGSILHHGVPDAVMYGDYGCDDMDWLIRQSDRPDTVRIEARGKTFHISIARLDNRVDKTTFVRADRAAWKPADVAALHAGLQGAFEKLARARTGGVAAR